MFVRSNRFKPTRFHPYWSAAHHKCTLPENYEKPRTSLGCTEKSSVHDGRNGNGNGNGFDSGTLLVEGWKEKHASSSEAIVKADRHGKDISTTELQEITVKHMTKSVKTVKPPKHG